MLIGRNLSFLPRIAMNPSSANTVTNSSNIPVVHGKVKELLSKKSGSISVYYKNLKTGESFGLDENKVITGASLNKLMIVAHLYYLAGEHKINLEDKIVTQKNDIKDYGTGSLRYEEPGKAYSLKTLAKLTLEESDNTAAYLIAVRIGKNETQAFIDKIGLSSTQMENNVTTAKDMGKILELIYTYKITSPALTRELLDFLKDTDFEDRLPLYINREADVYHKTGDAVRSVHDVGIIVPRLRPAPFILSVLTTDIENEEETKKIIGEIAKTVYE